MMERSYGWRQEIGWMEEGQEQRFDRDVCCAGQRKEVRRAKEEMCAFSSSREIVP